MMQENLTEYPVKFRAEADTFSESLFITVERKHELHGLWSVLEFEELLKGVNVQRHTSNILKTCKTPEECCFAFLYIGRFVEQQVFKNKNR